MYVDFYDTNHNLIADKSRQVRYWFDKKDIAEVLVKSKQLWIANKIKSKCTAANISICAIGAEEYRASAFVILLAFSNLAILI